MSRQCSAHTSGKTAHISRVMGAAHRELFVGQQRPTIAMGRTCLHEAVASITVLHLLAILGKSRWVPHRVFRQTSDKPTEQQIGVQRRHQLPFTPHAVEHMQPRCALQRFGRDRRTPRLAYRVPQLGSRSRNTSPTHSRMVRNGLPCLEPLFQ